MTRTLNILGLLCLLLLGAIDGAGAQSNGTLVGSPSFVTGQFSQAVTLNGSSQYVSLGTVFSPAVNTTWTEECWLNTTISTGVHLAISAGDVSTPATIAAAASCWLGINAGKVQFNAGASSSVTTTTSVTDGAWHHIAVVVTSNTTATIYVDGTQAGTGSISWTPQANTYWFAGAWTQTANYWAGAIDEVSFSTISQYSSAFTRPAAAFTTSRTGQIALYHLDNNAFNAYVSNPSVFTSDNAGFIYLGKWAQSGAGSTARATTLTSGNQVRATVTGTATCQLNFDTSLCAAGQYPDIVYQLDGGGYTRATLDSTGNVTCAFPTFSGVSTSAYTTHTLTVFSEGVFDAGITAVNVWGTQAGALKFSGATLDSGASLVSALAPQSQIEFDGDSITETTRMLGGSGSNYGQTLKAAHIGWPVLTAQALGMAPVCSGYSGDGLVKTSNGGGTTTFAAVPLLQTAFASVYAGAAYTPSVHPVVDVLNIGTNDQGQTVSAATFQTAYQSMLTALRTRDPQSLIECVILPSANSYVSAIPAAISASGDTKTRVHDYTSGLFTAGDYASDGVHLNLSGNAKLAAQLSANIQADMTALGLKTQFLTGTILALTITQNGSSQPVLTWTADPAATLYKVLRSTDGVNYTVITTPAVGTLTYTDTARPAGATVYYHITSTH